MSKLIKLSIAALFACATAANAADESNWIFPSFSTRDAGVSNASSDLGVQGRRAATTAAPIKQPQSWIDNNDFRRSAPSGQVDGRSDYKGHWQMGSVLVSF